MAASIRFRLDWRGEQFKRTLDRQLLQDLDEAGAIVADRAKALVSSPASPSAPGQPPARVSGALVASIGHDVVVFVDGPHALVFAGTAYARRLELGFFGTDSLGRRYAQAPRPYLRPALVQANLAPAFA